MRHPLSDGPLPFGELAFCQRDYREFACSKETFEWLSSGAMAMLDEVPIRLQIMDVCVGGFNVWVRIWPATNQLEEWVQPAVRKTGEHDRMAA